MLTFILPAVVVIVFTLPLVKVFKGKVSKDSAKHRLALHVSGFFGAVTLVLFMSLSSSPVFAAEASIAGTLAQGLGFIAAALATGAAPAAIGAFSENSENFGRSLIFVALGEGVAIYGLLISILIINAL